MLAGTNNAENNDNREILSLNTESCVRNDNVNYILMYLPVYKNQQLCNACVCCGDTISRSVASAALTPFNFPEYVNWTSVVLLFDVHEPNGFFSCN